MFDYLVSRVFFNEYLFYFNKKNYLLTFLFFTLSFYSQEELNESVDSLYREDQIYFGITYNTLINTPESLTQTDFSPGFSLGIIRDFPINKERDIALGFGMGYSLNIYSQNLKIVRQNNNNFLYELVSSQDFEKNRFSFQAIEIPFEIRWRTSNKISYKFWRIYFGIKTSYIVNSKSIFTSENLNQSNKNLDLNKWQYGLSLSLGYNNWNSFFYYGLNSIFNNVLLAETPIEMRSLNIGLIFYIL